MVSIQINDNIVVGLGIYNPFDFAVEWPLSWGITKQPTVWLGSNKARQFNINTWYFNPTVAYRMNDELSVGIGISYVYATMNKMTEIMQIEAKGSGYNVNVGAIYKPRENLSIGVSYRMKTDIEFSGGTKFAGGSQTRYLYPATTGKVKMLLPGNFIVGAAYELIPDLSIEGDLQYVQWSEYNQLKVEITPTVPNAPTVPNTPITQKKNWQDAITLRGGIEYKIDQDFTIRAGGILDLSPQPPSKTEPSMPDGDRIDISIGGSYKYNDNLSFDVAYMLGLFQERDAKNSNLTGSIDDNEAGVPGIYNGRTNTISINIGYTF